MKKLLPLLLAVILVASVLTVFAGLTVSAADDVADYLGGEKTADIVLTMKKLEATNPAITSGHGMNIANFFDAVSANSKIEGNINGTLTITWETPEAATASYYVLYTGNDNESWNGRNPAGFTLYGSVDGAEYVVLDEVSDPDLEERNNAPFAYAIDAPASYQYYKLDIKKDAGYFQMNGIELYTDEVVSSIPLTQDTDENSLTYGRYQLTVSSGNAGAGCGFVDGNMNIESKADATYGKTLDFQHLAGTNDLDTLYAEGRIFIDGVAVSQNKTYKGYTHCGINGNGGFWMGLVGAKFTQGVESTITLLVGDKYYATYKFTPDVNTLAVASSNAVYYSELGILDVTVTFVEDHGLAVNDTVTFRLHDDHNDRTATVTAVDGKTVTLKATDFSSNHTLLEFTKADGTKFSLSLNEQKNTITDKAVGYIQTRVNAADSVNKFDTRLVVEANAAYIAQFTSATIEMTFTTADGGSKVITSKTSTAYKKVTAGDYSYSASDECALFGVVVLNVPNGTSAVSANVTFANGDVSETIELGSATLKNPYTIDTDTTGATCMNTIEGVNSHVHAFEKPSEFGGPVGLVYYFQDDATKHHETMAQLIADGGYAVVSIDGNLYKVTQYANGAPWFRMNVESVGATIYSGLTYKIIVYVYDNQHVMKYYTNEETTVSGLSTANAAERTPSNITLPDGLTKIDNKTAVGSISAEGLSAWGDGPATNLLDGDNQGTKIGGGTSGSVTVNFTLNTASTVTYYSLYTGGDTASNSGRNPTAWTLYGKVGEEWVELSTIASTMTTVPGIEATNSTPYSYQVSNPQECTEYKIVFVTGGQFQLNELELYVG